MVKMAPYGRCRDRRGPAAADEVTQGIIAGTLHPFTGPINNQAGEVVIADGETPTDDEMQKMDWWVKGVQA